MSKMILIMRERAYPMRFFSGKSISHKDGDYQGACECLNLSMEN
jgi:hypothetical protein